ncbi:outer membrane receptor protein involved in Fe transport [Flavobacterium arsenatis]|uniref:Outer membrane receptor protein involved in Fe transport n=1 Tax=Flavobacterium arsenatis TaxID=1484332 RepID=A0ABU1TL24_9FLAO|nr:TonB-dependent receptor [Flavobacterium arsenatis]MDR6966651.1 outer membrane receptor protein involved in Fe transport [Flavobacterium arsenatis]
MKFKFLIITLFICFISFAQNKGTVSGTITDKDLNNEVLPFANVMVKGTTIGVSTDMDGKYSLSVPAGNHVLEISFVGYETMEVPFTVKANETTIVDRAIGSGSVKLEDIVIENNRKRNTETAIMMEIKEAKQVVSAISAEQMSRGTDGNAAEAVQRVPGITIVDGKFVMIRGLSERYNNVLLNGSIAPSTEIDKRTFAFDLISTSTLDKMVIYKTGSASMPGDFAGGIIAVSTAESAAEFTKIDVGFGYRPGTSFDSYLQSEGSSTDFLGFDKSFRPLPSGFVSGANNVVAPDVANRLPNNFNPTESTAFLDNSIGFSLGRNIPLKGNNKLFTINSLSYSNSFQNIDRQFTRYSTLNAGETVAPIWFQYQDNIYQNTISLTGLSNWMLKLGDNTKIKFKNLFNQKGTNETTIRNGNNFLQRGDDLLRNYYMIYQSRTLYTSQLEGEHKLGSKNIFDWVLGYNSIADNVPDFRRFRTFKQDNDPASPYIMIDPPSSNPFDAGRYYGELSEYSVNNGMNFTHLIERIKGDEELGTIKLKAGFYGSYRKRDFSAKYFTYLIPGTVAFERAEELRRLPISEVFSSQYVNANGWSLREGTRPSDSYTADNKFLSGYMQGEFPLKRFDITAGVRLEHNVQTLDSRDEVKAIKVDNPVTSVLPSLNVGYNLNENSILRFAYSRTVNRPEFRELAPFLFYDYTNDVNIVGNPDLETATIDNLDIRYEFYPSKSETVSLGAFYKKFDTPIELTTVIVGENPQFVYNNAASANNYGVEFELKKSFKGWTNSIFMDRISANLNASYIFSEVDLGSAAIAQQQKRALQGQSPYIINAALGYKDENDFGVNLVYNRFGDRIFSVSDNNFPSIYELARNNVDLTVSKKINKTTFKLGVQNLLNDKYRFFEDSNRDEKIDRDADNATSVFKRGALFTLNVSYNF